MIDRAPTPLRAEPANLVHLRRYNPRALVAQESVLFDGIYYVIKARENIDSADTLDQTSDEHFERARAGVFELRRRFPDAEGLALSVIQDIDAGLHFDLVEGQPVRDANRELIGKNQDCCRSVIRLIERELTGKEQGS